MDQLKAWLRFNGAAVISRMMAAIGFDTNTANAVNGVFINGLYSPIGDVLAVAFALPVWLSTQIQNVSPALPGWVTWLYNYVTGTVQSELTWMTGAVQQIRSQLDSLTGGIDALVVNSIAYALNAYRDALTFAQRLYNQYGGLLISFLDNSYGFIAGIFEQLIPALFTPFVPLLQFYNLIIQPALQFLTSFLSDPAGFVSGIFRQLIDAALLPMRPLLDFLVWWQNTGAPFLLALIADPETVLFDLLAPGVIDWLMSVLAAKW